MELLSEARMWVNKGRDKGVTCPCCDQFAKIYNRKLNTAMARTLISVSQYFEQGGQDDYLHIEKYLARRTRATDFYKLKFWGIIESKPLINGTVSCGMWKVTPLGFDFVHRRCTVPKRAAIYNDELLGFSKDHTDIVESLGEYFDYSELMNAVL